LRLTTSCRMRMRLGEIGVHVAAENAVKPMGLDGVGYGCVPAARGVNYTALGDGTMKRSLLLTTGMLALPMLTWGSSFSGTLIKGDISNPLCPADLPFQRSGSGPLSSGLISTGACSFSAGGFTITGSAAGFADADLFGKASLMSLRVHSRAASMATHILRRTPSTLSP